MKNLETKALLTLIIGVCLILVAPFLFTRDWGLFSFSETGDIGKTIGGITAPITGLIGALLIFFALKAQIDANQLINNTFE